MTVQPSVRKSGFGERDEFVARIVTRAWKDEAYKRKLLDDPKAVLAEELGTAIPDQVEVHVLEETQNVRYIAIPYKRDHFPSVTAEELASGSSDVTKCPTNTSTAITSPCDCG
jgi:Nitrile hydratase, alpha chain